MVSSIFDLAAKACGYDTSTGVGAELARADYRVWDLVGEYRAEVNAQAAEALADMDWAEALS